MCLLLSSIRTGSFAFAYSKLLLFLSCPVIVVCFRDGVLNGMGVEVDQLDSFSNRAGSVLHAGVGRTFSSISYAANLEPLFCLL